jgi:hypothetical protein
MDQSFAVDFHKQFIKEYIFCSKYLSLKDPTQIYLSFILATRKYQMLF